jgi:tetratricopeptide (TPR) repeat protein
MTLATLRAWQNNPIWGAGLGTHAYVFPMFDTSANPALAGHADNDYVQLLEEMGLVGAALVLVFLIGVATIIAKLAVSGRTASSAAAFGLAFGLIAVAIHSASDFGQRLPANLCLSAATCGLLVAIARMERRRAAARQRKLPAAVSSNSWHRVGVSIASVAGLIVLWGWAGRDTYAAFIGERWWAAALTTETRIRNEPDQATDDNYRELLAMASAAFESDPANVEYGHWLNSFRWEAISRTVDPDTGQVVLHADVLPLVHQIADSLAAVRRICPTFGPPYALEGQLRLLVLEQESGATLIRKGVQLASYDAPTCLAAGQLAVREGNLEEAQWLLARAVDLQPRYFEQVVAIYLEEARRPDLARSLAGDDYGRLAQLAEASAAIPQYAELSSEFQEAATAALRRGAANATATSAELVALARIEGADGNTPAAIGHYRAALNQDYRRVDWRLELARILDATGEIEKAIDEVRLSLRLRPHYAPAEKLLEELIGRREAVRE